MRLFGRVKDRCLCAFCGSDRHFYAKKHLGLTNVFLAFLFAICAGTAIWGWVDPRWTVLFGLGLGVAEAFIYLRWRSFIVCHHCGFDPVLYCQSPERARTKVRAFYEKRIQDPDFLLSRSPLVEVYRRTQTVKRQNEVVRARQDAVPSQSVSRPEKAHPPARSTTKTSAPQKQA